MNVLDMTCELLNETFKCHHVYYVLGTMLKTEQPRLEKRDISEMQPAKWGCIEIELNCQSFKNALVQQAGVQQTFKARGLI